MSRVLPQDHVETSPYNTESLNNLNIAGSSSNENRMPASPSVLLNRNIFGSEPMSATSSNSNECNLQNMNEDEGMSDGHNDQTNGEYSAAHSSAANSLKDIKFNIQHKNTTHNVVVFARSTIGDLKAKIFEITSIPTCRQSWCGWVQSENYDDSTALNTINLSDENELIVNDIKDLENDLVAVDESAMERLTRTFKLNIFLGNTNNTSPLQLNFTGTRSIADVKKDVYSVTNIAVRYQQWHGWPIGISDDTTLGLAGIPYEHDLVLNNLGLNSTETSTNQITPPNQAGTDETARSNTGNELIEIDSPATKRRREPYPQFYEGTLKEALDEACHNKPPKDRKLLAIYLHHDKSVLANVFCDRVMKNDTIRQTIEHNFILYGWDFTNENNDKSFSTSLLACGFNNVPAILRQIRECTLPAIIVICKNSSGCEVISVINGDASEVSNKLMEIKELYSKQRDDEVQEDEKFSKLPEYEKLVLNEEKRSPTAPAIDVADQGEGNSPYTLPPPLSRRSASSERCASDAYSNSSSPTASGYVHTIAFIDREVLEATKNGEQYYKNTLLELKEMIRKNLQRAYVDKKNRYKNQSLRIKLLKNLLKK